MFRRILGRKGREGGASGGVILRLKYEPSPETLPLFASDIVGSAREVSGVTLDYTPASLALVDDIVEGFRAERLTERDIGETLFGFGCYVGEVFVRNAGGQWRRTDETPMRDVAGHRFVIELPDGTFCNPLAKVFKRLANGAEDGLGYFYTVFAKQRPT